MQAGVIQQLDALLTDVATITPLLASPPAR
jgi:hypothetical protein